jgi:hypothetical protein
MMQLLFLCPIEGKNIFCIFGIRLFKLNIFFGFIEREYEDGSTACGFGLFGWHNDI